MLSPAQIDDCLARADCVALAEDFGAVLRRSGRRIVGSCPLCGGDRRATRFEVSRETWVCAACCSGGDAIALVRAARNIDFRAAVEFLGGAREIDPQAAERAARARADREARRAADAARYREKERARLWALWRSADRAAPDAHAYLCARGLAAPQPFAARSLPALDYFHGEWTDAQGRAHPRSIHRGPAMLTPFIDAAGRFAGLHITWIDCASAATRFKAQIADPDTGELLPAKKMRGAVKGCALPLTRAPAPARLIMGEGIETTLAARAFLLRAGALRTGDVFWAAGSLFALGGAALGAIAHPDKRHANGHRIGVPGAAPDMAGPFIRPPDGCAEVVLLGDGDSDPFTTALALERGVARYRAMGLAARFVAAAAGQDFGDMWQAAQAAPTGEGARA